MLAGETGRPGGLKDDPCLARLTAMGMVSAQDDQRYRATPAGIARHRHEILRQAETG
jgi:hypothetical protein